MIRLAITDDENIVRQGLVEVLSRRPGIQVALVAHSGRNLLEQLRTAPVLPQVLLLDLRMRELNGIETTRLIRTQYASIHIIILSSFDEDHLIVQMIREGAAAYLQKNCDLNILEEAIHKVVEQGYYYTDEVQRALYRQLSNPQLSSPLPDFTEDERIVLCMVCKGFTNREIGEKIHRSDRTVEKRRLILLRKANCQNTAELISFAAKHHLCQAEPGLHLNLSLV